MVKILGRTQNVFLLPSALGLGRRASWAHMEPSTLALEGQVAPSAGMRGACILDGGQPDSGFRYCLSFLE